MKVILVRATHFLALYEESFQESLPDGEKVAPTVVVEMADWKGCLSLAGFGPTCENNLDQQTPSTYQGLKCGDPAREVDYLLAKADDRLDSLPAQSPPRRRDSVAPTASRAGHRQQQHHRGGWNDHVSTTFCIAGYTRHLRLLTEQLPGLHREPLTCSVEVRCGDCKPSQPKIMILIVSRP